MFSVVPAIVYDKYLNWIQSSNWGRSNKINGVLVFDEITNGFDKKLGCITGLCSLKVLCSKRFKFFINQNSLHMGAVHKRMSKGKTVVQK